MLHFRYRRHDVRCAHRVIIPLLHCPQVAAFILCAIAHLAAFLRWRTRGVNATGGWLLYGWFTKLSCLGSVAGAFAYGARMRNLSLLYSSRKLELLGNLTLSQSRSFNLERSGENRFAAAFYLLYPFELSFVVSAQLLVLHRLQKLCWIDSASARVRLICRRTFLSSVVILNVIGALSDVAAAAYFIQAADAESQAADAWASNSSDSASSLQLLGRKQKAAASNCVAIQRFCEMIMLLLIITAFLIVGAKSSRVITSALRALSLAKEKALGTKTLQLFAQATTAGRLLHRKIALTFVFVFVTLLLRSVFSVMFSAALAFQDIGSGCATNVCDACYNTYSHITFWILYLPLFQQFVTLIASPISLLVALWGMSGIETLEQVPVEHEKLDSARQSAVSSGQSSLQRFSL